MSRFTRAAWLDLGLERLRDEGPEALTIERMCQAAGRTKGSFYHHFGSATEFLAAVIGRWRERATDRIAEAALAARTPELALRTLGKLTGRMDHRLDVAVRRAAIGQPALETEVEAADQRREAVLAQLMASAYVLDEARARAAARLFHSVHLAGQLRAPDDVEAFTREAYGALLRWVAV
ncbi:TetR/AcrR family transcriptional regulator [Brevundimonas sp. 2R-24]|uniref:TetR/AcrR family transcriptional regulator n=1 Tax=Peiella sedimenti TaxID=3061083 RepID=A0ABT8SMP0_9CAUL|nr:TetR/AcrR family transcriptional regulator [Caulobacteraceae bacterium XZ-24]